MFSRKNCVSGLFFYQSYLLGGYLAVSCSEYHMTRRPREHSEALINPSLAPDCAPDLNAESGKLATTTKIQVTRFLPDHFFTFCSFVLDRTIFEH